MCRHIDSIYKKMIVECMKDPNWEGYHIKRIKRNDALEPMNIKEIMKIKLFNAVERTNEVK